MKTKSNKLKICICNICGIEFKNTDSRRRYCPEHRAKQQSWRNKQSKIKPHPDLVGVKAKQGTVVCTGSIAKRCRYGSTCGGTYCCNFILIEGYSRGCPPKACDKYRPGPKARFQYDIGRMVFPNS